MNEREITYDASGAQPRARIARLHRGGNSLGVYVPRLIVDQLRLAAADEVRLYVVNGCLVIEPVRQEGWTPAVTAAEVTGVSHGG